MSSKPQEPPCQDALRRAVDAVQQAESDGHPWALALALSRLGRCYRHLEARGAAVRSFEQALRWSLASGSHDQAVDLLCELCELFADESERLELGQRGSGRPARERARDHAFEAAAMAPRVADADWEVTVLLRLSDVLDRFGDRDDATRLQVRALRLTVGPVLPADRPSADDALTQHRH